MAVSRFKFLREQMPAGVRGALQDVMYMQSIRNGSWKFRMIINCGDSSHVAYTPHGPGESGIRGPMSPAICLAAVTRVIGQTRVRVNTRMSGRIFMSRVRLRPDSDSFRDRNKCEQTGVKG